MAHILVVDDDDAVREVLSRLLEAGGHTVRQAETGSLALELLRATPVDVALVDLILPGQCGFELITALRHAAPNLAIIAMSGGIVDLERCSKIAGDLGVTHLLEKPFTGETLLTIVEESFATVEVV